MKATGITRKIDEMGRFSIPIELRRSMGIMEGDSLEVFTDDGRIMIQKYKPDLEKTAVVDRLNELIVNETDQALIQTYQRAITLIK